MEQYFFHILDTIIKISFNWHILNNDYPLKFSLNERLKKLFNNQVDKTRGDNN